MKQLQLLTKLCIACAFCFIVASATPAFATEGIAPGTEAIYEQEKVMFTDVETYLAEMISETGLSFDPVANRFEFYNATLQRSEGVFWSYGGVLSDIPLVRGHNYIVSVYERGHEASCLLQIGPNVDDQVLLDKYYFTLNESGKRPINTKTGSTKQVDVMETTTSPYLIVTDRPTRLENADDCRRVACSLPVYATSNGQKTNVPGVKVRLTSPDDTIEVVSDAEGFIHANLREGSNYMVEVDSSTYGIESFPLIIKDQSEHAADVLADGWAQFPYKYAYNHITGQMVEGLALVQKGKEHSHDTTVTATSKKTTVGGMNFNSSDYVINDRVLEDLSIPDLEGQDFEAVAIEAVNTQFNELSKLAKGSFAITRNFTAGKNVKAVYTLDSKGALQPLDFKQNQNKVEFTTGTLSMYPTVIVYEPVDKTALRNNIKAATDSMNRTKISTNGNDIDSKDMWVTDAEKQALNAVLAAAQRVLDSERATQAQVDSVAAAVKAAQEAFDQAKRPGKKASVTTKTALKSATAKNQNYTGKALKPAVTVKDAKGNTVPASAYTVKYTNNVNPGTATATVTAKKDSKYTGTVKATFKITAKDTPVYWLYNKNTGENLYTAALPEKNVLSKKPQWQFKKIVWYAPTTGEPVYRLVNKVTNDHHWTKSKTEANTLVKRGKWKMDFGGKPAFYSGGGKTVWRLRHDARIAQQKAGTHRFATSTNEVNTLKKSKWVKESETLKAIRYK